MGGTTVCVGSAVGRTGRFVAVGMSVAVVVLGEKVHAFSMTADAAIPIRYKNSRRGILGEFFTFFLSEEIFTKLAALLFP